MAEIHLYLVFNLDEQYQPLGMLSLETDQGSVVPVFTIVEAAYRFLASPALQRLMQQSRSPKGVIQDTASSFEDRLFRLRMMDPVDGKRHLSPRHRPAWRTLSTQLG